MAYESKLTYSIYDLNSTKFVENIREILEVEFLHQRDEFGADFLPETVHDDDYLLNPINADTDLNPAFCAIARVKADLEDQFHKQQNVENQFIIQIVAIGLSNLRKIADSVFIILNDMDVKNHLFHLKDDNGEFVVYNSETYKVNSITTELQTEKTKNNKDVVMGNVIVTANISETVKFNETEPITNVVTVNQLGENGVELVQENIY